MPIGFQSFTDSGILQIDSDKFTYMLKQKGTLTGTFQGGFYGGGYYTAGVTITGCNTPIMFSSAGSTVSSSQDNGGGSWTFAFRASDSSISYALFDIGLSSGSTFGLQLYNSSNQVTFDSNLIPLIIVFSGTENVFTGSYSEPSDFLGEEGRVYYGSGINSYRSYAGSEVFEGSGDFQNYLIYSILDEQANYYGPSTVESIGSTNDANKDEGTTGDIAWLLADVTNILTIPDVPPPFSISKSGDATATRLGSGSITTNSVTITPTNASGAVTYSWALTSGDNDFTVTSPTSASSTFTATFTAPDSASSTYTVTGLDSLGATATVNVGVTASATVFFAPVTVTRTSGTGATETVPTGATSVRIRVGGGGGGGGISRFNAEFIGGGGGEGGFVERTIAVVGGNTLTYTVGRGGEGADGGGNYGFEQPGVEGGVSTVSGSGLGPLSNINLSMSARGGAGGRGFIGGGGGIASGAPTNIQGAAGSTGEDGGAGGTGASPQSGEGGGGGQAPYAAAAGFRGEIEFYYT